MMTLQQHRERFIRQLAGVYPPAEADWLFFLFLERQTGISRTTYFARPDKKVEIPEVEAIIRRLAAGEPWQYVAGETEFYGLRLLVDNRVLIPRPETERLAHMICSEASSPKRILDVGTGSGCLALALKKCFPQAEVTGMDFQSGVLELARQNARNNDLEIRWVEGDILAGRFPSGPWDVVVSNPPYVLPDEKPDMHRRVKEYEPAEALFVPAADPVVYYRKIMDFFTKQSGEGARLYFEINPRCTASLEQTARERQLDYEFLTYAGQKRFMRLRKI